MRFAIPLGAAVAFSICGTYAAADDQPATASVNLADAGYEQQVVPVQKGVWLLAQPKFQVQPCGNVTVIEQSDGLVLVDAGGSKGAGQHIVQIIHSLSTKPVKAVIISQWHGDKPQGLSEILKEWPKARTISTAKTQAYLSNPATMNTPGSPDAAGNARFQTMLQRYEARLQTTASKADTEDMRKRYEQLVGIVQQWARDMDGALTIPTRESFTDKIIIDDAHAPVEAMFLGRANTDGDAVVWMPKQRILISGETVILPFPYGFESFPSDWISVLEKERAMPFKVLLPGHGMPQTDRRQLDNIIAALRDVHGQVASLAAQGLTLEQVQARVDLSADRKVFVGDDPWLGRWFHDFWAVPITASAYKEIKGEPIVQSLKG